MYFMRLATATGSSRFASSVRKAERGADAGPAASQAPYHSVSPVALPGRTEPCFSCTAYYSIRNAKALSRLGKGLDLRKLVAGAGFEPATSGL
jgi:hypothetical protein